MAKIHEEKSRAEQVAKDQIWEPQLRVAQIQHREGFPRFWLTLFERFILILLTFFFKNDARRIG